MAHLKRIILGTMEVGRRMDLHQTREFIDLFLSYGHHELDSAYMYSGGADGGPQGGDTERLLGKLQNLNETVKISTKANPGGEKTLSPASLRHQLETSLRHLNKDHVDIFYLHWPCLDTPLDDTLNTVNTLHKEGKFREFGLSNFISWQIVEIHNICKNAGYIVPTVYQGMYNCFTRMVETELFPCLQRYNMSFLAYNPLAGGLLTNKHKRSDDPQSQADMSGRFYGTDNLVEKYRERYWRARYFDALEILSDVCMEEGIEVHEAALRWLQYHSWLGAEDGIVIGGSNCDNLNRNLAVLHNRGPLPGSVVEAIERGYQITAGHGPPYFRNVNSRFSFA